MNFVKRTVLTLKIEKAKIRSLIGNLDLSCLKERDRNVLLTYIFNDEVSLKFVGDVYGISPERVRQIVNENIYKLKRKYHFDI